MWPLNRAFGLLCIAGMAGAAELPKGFVYLADIAPQIEQDLKYASADNFLSRPVNGYVSGRCILTRRAALALAHVANSLAPQGLGLRVYDCYRPTRAVADFVHWSQDPTPAPAQAYYFARYTKKSLFKRGFIARRSGHSRGSTVDLTLVSTPQFDADKKRPAQNDTAASTTATRCDARLPEHRLPVGSALDMGTDFDCFSPHAAHGNTTITKQAKRNRRLLLKVMHLAGFKSYQREWWHYRLQKEPYAKQSFNFVVK